MFGSNATLIIRHDGRTAQAAAAALCRNIKVRFSVLSSYADGTSKIKVSGSAEAVNAVLLMAGTD